MSLFLKPDAEYDALSSARDSIYARPDAPTGQPLVNGVMQPGTSVRLSSVSQDDSPMLAFSFASSYGNFQIRYGDASRYVALVFRRNGCVVEHRLWKAGWRRNGTTTLMETSSQALVQLPITAEFQSSSGPMKFPARHIEVQRGRLVQADIRDATTGQQVPSGIGGGEYTLYVPITPQVVGGVTLQPWQQSINVPGSRTGDIITAAYCESSVQEWYDVTIELVIDGDRTVLNGPVSVPDVRRGADPVVAQGMIAAKASSGGIQFSAVAGPRYGGHNIGFAHGRTEAGVNGGQWTIYPSLNFPFGDFFGGDTAHLLASVALEPPLRPSWWLDGIESPGVVEGTTIYSTVGNFAVTSDFPDIFIQPGYTQPNRSAWVQDNQGRLRYATSASGYAVARCGIGESPQTFTRGGSVYSVQGAVKLSPPNQLRGSQVGDGVSAGWGGVGGREPPTTASLVNFSDVGSDNSPDRDRTDALASFGSCFIPRAAHASLARYARQDWFAGTSPVPTRRAWSFQLGTSAVPGVDSQGEACLFKQLRETDSFSARLRLHRERLLAEVVRLNSVTSVAGQVIQSTYVQPLRSASWAHGFSGSAVNLYGQSGLENNHSHVVATLGDATAMAFSFQPLPALSVLGSPHVTPIGAEVTVSLAPIVQSPISVRVTTQDVDGNQLPLNLLWGSTTIAGKQYAMWLVLYPALLPAVDVPWGDFRKTGGFIENASSFRNFGPEGSSDQPASPVHRLIVEDPGTGLVDCSCTKTTGLMRKTVACVFVTEDKRPLVAGTSQGTVEFGSIGRGGDTQTSLPCAVKIDLWHDDIGSEVGLASTLTAGYQAFVDDGTPDAAVSQVGSTQIRWLYSLD